jgi:hypothetical protein
VWRNAQEDIMTTTHTVSDPFTAAVASNPSRPRLRSVGAVLAGLVTTFAVTTAVDVVLHATGVFPPMPEVMSDALFALALSYRIPFNAAGCYVAARLAPSRAFHHALALGAVGVVLATLGAIAMWDCGPAWYSLANVAVAMPCAWVGGRVAGRGAGGRGEG